MYAYIKSNNIRGLNFIPIIIEVIKVLMLVM
jgi:hypothetical protein